MVLIELKHIFFKHSTATSLSRHSVPAARDSPHNVLPAEFTLCVTVPLSCLSKHTKSTETKREFCSQKDCSCGRYALILLV